MTRPLVAASCVLALAAGARAQQTISVEFDFRLVGVFLGSENEQNAFEASVAEDLAGGLDAHVGFLDFAPGAKGSQPHHLLVALVPTSDTATGATFSAIECELSGDKEGRTDPLPFVDPEVLVDYRGRADLEARIRAAFAGGGTFNPPPRKTGWLPENRQHVVDRLFSQIPIRKQTALGYWALGERGFVPLPSFYSDLGAWHDTEFRLKLRGASPFDPTVDLVMPSVSYGDVVQPFLSEFEKHFADLEGYPDDYWKGANQRIPIVCALNEPARVPGVTADALASPEGAKGTLTAAEIFVVKYKHREWPVAKNVPGGKAGG